MSKKPIRVFNDREVWAVWYDENNCWWFLATDVVRDINDEADYTKASNYQRWLKRKLTQDGIQLMSATHGFKFEVQNGNQRKADVLNSKHSQKYTLQGLRIGCNFATAILHRPSTFNFMTRKEFEVLQSRCAASGQTLKAFLRSEGISYSTYNYWRKKCDSDSDTLPMAPILITEPVHES